MPLEPGKDKVGDNIRELHGGKVHAHTARKFGKNRADKQSIAIAMAKARGESLAARVVESLLREDDEHREVGIANEILRAISDSNSLPESRFAEIRKLANELLVMHRGTETDLFAPQSDWRDATPHRLGLGHP